MQFYLCRDLLCQGLELGAVGVFISLLEHLVGDPHGACVDLLDEDIVTVWRVTQRKLKFIDSHISFLYKLGTMLELHNENEKSLKISIWKHYYDFPNT